MGKRLSLRESIAKAVREAPTQRLPPVAAFTPEVYRDHNSRPVIVFDKARKYHVVEVLEAKVRLDTLDTLRGLTPLLFKGGPYPVKRAAKFYLSKRTSRLVTSKARDVLRSLVAFRAP